MNPANDHHQDHPHDEPGSTESRVSDPALDTPEDVRVDTLIEGDATIEAIADAVEQQEAPDAAETLETLPQADASDVLGEMEIDAAAEALSHMAVPLAVSVIEDLIEEDPAYAGRVLGEMAPDDATDLLQALPRKDRDRLLTLMAAGAALRVRELLVYPRESAGGIMTTQYLSVREHETVVEAIEHIRRGEPIESAQQAFVTDRKGRLRGVIGLRKLLVSRATDLICDICERRVDAVQPEIDRELLAREFERYDYLELPVVDKDQRLLGIVTVDDVIDIIRAEGTEDAQRMVGAGKEEGVYSTVVQKLRGRFPWLIVNLFTSTVAALIVLRFEGIITEIALLAALMPLIANQAGNAGQQSLAVTLRGIVLDHIRPQRSLGHIRRELTVGAVNGLLCGLIVGTVVAVVKVATGGSWHLGLVIAMSMTITLMIGCGTGSAMPLIVRRLGFDPATASTIFLTMVTDSMSFFVFLGLATLFYQWIT
ncbi:MAG: magnesium transporter [Phycisphaerales bacterium]|nr:magnesium transporter [Phycisphaerales bacterium]